MALHLRTFALLGLIGLASCTEQPLTPSLDVTVTATNGKIAFSSNRNGDYDIYVMEPDGSGLTNITNSPGPDHWAAWSPDGTKIAFGSAPDFAQYDIYVMNADGTNRVRLTTDLANDFHPTWSPDGSQIAFVSERSGSRQIWVMNADGTGQANLSNNAFQNEQPHWSPDGTVIAFNRSGTDGVTNDGGGEVYLMNAANGSGQTNLTNTPVPVDSPNDWSPDGSKILFSTTRDGGNTEVYVMDANGANPVRLTNNGATDQWATWSPDGTAIAFYTDRDGNNEVYRMNADGTAPINLTNNPLVDFFPDWGVAAVVNNPTTAEQCKNGGWASYGFSNQGQCVRYVETGKDSRLGE